MSKACCGVTVTQAVSIRWFIVMIAFVGICCSVVGTVLGAMKASGREHLTVSLLMIGVGIVLITVSGIAWRLTSTDAPSCGAMLGIGGGGSSAYDDDYNGRFLARPSGMTAAMNYGRPQHPYAAMMYSDFHYRPPPPSYQASMQEYRLRLLLLDRNNTSQSVPPPAAAAPAAQPPTAAVPQTTTVPPPPPSTRQNASNPNTVGIASPPPVYRSHLRNAMAHAIAHSRPPSYRSHISDHEIILPPGSAVVHLPKPPVAEEPEITDQDTDNDAIVVATPSSPQTSVPVSRHGGPLPSELNNPDGKHGVDGKVTTVMTSDDGYNLIKTPSPAKEEAVHVQQEKRRSFVDIKDVSTDSSVVSFSSNGSTTLNDTVLGQGPEGSPRGGQVTIIHHQQARRHQAPPPPAAVHRPAVTVSSGQANSNNTSVHQPLCVSALVTAGSNNPAPPSTEQAALDVENEASVEILAHL